MKRFSFDCMFESCACNAIECVPVSLFRLVFDLSSIVVTWSFCHPHKKKICDPVKLCFVVNLIGIDLRNDPL